MRMKSRFNYYSTISSGSFQHLEAAVFELNGTVKIGPRAKRVRKQKCRPSEHRLKLVWCQDATWDFMCSWTFVAICHAKTGGTALPICLSVALMAHTKENASGND